MNEAVPEWQRWIGSTEHLSDRTSLESLTRMSATLDRDDPPWRAGDPIPPLWHQMYFPAVVRDSAIGPDGHPARGDFLPPIPLPRRMFAGARQTYHRPLRAGELVERKGEVVSIDRKTGKSGELVFVLVRYQIVDSKGLAIEEEHDIVYREAATKGAAVKSDAADTVDEAFDWRRTVTPDPVVLFRYSALTFNGHRIHYDRTYAMEEEGYPGLVVHGPLIATYLAELAREHVPDRRIGRFAFRARRPLFDTAPFEVAGTMSEDGAGCRLTAITPEGLVAMTADVDFAGN